MQPMSPSLLEHCVFSKPYFEPEGLIVATHDGRPVGFVHAGFGPNEDESALDTETGTTHLLMLGQDHHDPAVADELLSRSEAYLAERGAKVIYAGGVRPMVGFYLGLYGGSEIPGVLATDTAFEEACRRNGYREIDRVLVLRRDLGRLRPAVSREQRRVRRMATCRENYCPSPRSWWDACTTGSFERIDFFLESTKGSQPLANVCFWDIEPLSTGWQVPTAGMFDLQVNPDARRQGLATFLLGEVFTRLRNRGIVLVEAQAMRGNTPALAMYQKLGFDTVDHGYVFRKGE